MEAMDEDRALAEHDTRKPYLDAAKHDPAKPGTRALSAGGKTAAIDAMAPKPGAGGTPAVFTRVTPDGKDYGDEIRDALTALVGQFHKELYDDKVGLRADPAKNLHDWTVMEGPPKASKQVTDTLYASNYGGTAAFPAMTHAGGNLIDQWTDEESRNAVLTDPQKKAKARDKVVYLPDVGADVRCHSLQHAHRGLLRLLHAQRSQGDDDQRDDRGPGRGSVRQWKPASAGYLRRLSFARPG